MRLSVYLIVRNEETSLPHCLDSVKNIADEILISDTGSTDGTVDVARRYTSKVFTDYTWESSFAKARNAHIGDCTGDWILILDADETLEAESGKKLKPFLETVGQDVSLVMCTMEMQHDDGRPFQRFQAERILSNGRGLQFVADMHNWVDCPQEARIAVPAMKICHNRKHKTDEQRTERSNQRIGMADGLAEKAKVDGDDRRSRFYLAGTLFDAGKRDEAIPIFEEYLSMSDWPEERYEAALLLAQCYCGRNEMDKAYKVLGQHIGDNWRRAELLLMLGQIAYKKGDYEQAEWWCKIASLKPEPVDPLFVEVDAHSWEPHNMLWLIYQKMDDNVRAAEHGRQAVTLGAPNSAEIVQLEKNHTAYSNEKIAVLIDRGQRDFIAPLIEHWRCQGKEVEETADPADLERLVEWSDCLWCEWAGELAVKATNIPKCGRIVVRVHGYELNMDYLERINWTAVDDCIFVSRTLKEQCCERVPIHLWCNCYVVPGGVDTSKFTIGEGKQGNKIAMLGYVNQRKNIPLALQILAACSDKELHIAGEWQDAELQRYVEYLADELSLEGRLFLYGRVEDANTFFADKDFILSTSLRETFHYALAEGMAAGLAPVIHNWESASDFYPEDRIFSTVEEVVRMIQSGSGDSQGWRQYVVENLDLAKNLRRIDRIVKRPSVAVCGEPKFPYAHEYRVARAMESLGCRTEAPDLEFGLIMGASSPWDSTLNKSKVAVWVDDRVGDTPRDLEGIRARSVAIARADMVLVENDWWVDWLKREGARNVELFVLFGAMNPFRPLDGIEEEFDVGFFGWPTEYRDPKIEALAERWNVGYLHDCPDHEQANVFMNKCKIMVHLHAYPMADGTPNRRIPPRIFEAMSAGRCVVSEVLPKNHPFPSDCFVETDDVAGAIGELLDDDVRRVEIGKRAHKWIWSKFTLESQVEKLLEKVGL